VDSFVFGKPHSPYSTPDAERSLSTFDLPSRVTGSYLYELSFGRGRTFNIDNRFWNALGGLRLWPDALVAVDAGGRVAEG
jgi:hypothetical protein